MKMRMIPLREIENECRIKCPYCGRPGRVANCYPDGTFFIVHRVARESVLSQASERWIECDVVKDCCYRGLEITREKF